jgi:outer membrane protein assembly factor BamB
VRYALLRAVPAAALLSLALTGCSGLGWLGEADDPPLPGERRPVMLLERELSADPRLATMEVRLPRPERNAAWPQGGGAATHAMHHLAVGDDLRPAWRAGVGAGSGGSRQLLARPVAAEGRVFAMDADGVVSAFDAASGERVWRFEADDLDDDDGLLGGGLAYGGGWLFAATASGEVIGLNAARGERVWRTRLNVPLRTGPTVAGSRLLVLSADNQLFALDVETGRTLWRHAGFPELAGLLGGASPAVADGVAIVPYSSAEVFALRLEDGQPVWVDTVQRPRRTSALAEINDIDGDPVIDGDLVLVAGQGGQMAALDLRRGTRAWDLELAATQTPWVAGDFVYVLTTRNEVVCLLRGSGQVRWVSPLARLADPDEPDSAPVRWAGPVLAGDRLLLAGSHGEAVSLSPYTGEVLGRLDLPGPVRIAPIVADGTVYMLTERGELLAYR